ncbi:MAG: hypothetical protein AB6733_00240 [Clostridiaceae bacterium]
MAAKKEKNIKAKAKINLKYGELVVKAGQEFDVREVDLEAVQGFVEVFGEASAEDAEEKAE